MLEIASLTVRYGPFLAVDRLSIAIGAGEIVGIVGPNGAGKSSIVKVLGGLVKPVEGTAAFDGRDLLGLPAHERIGLGISIVPEGRGLFPRMSVEENLIVAGDTLNSRPQRSSNIERCFELFPILEERRRQPAGTLSGGQQQMVALAMGLMSGPRLLVLDEPSLGLAPIVIGEIGKALRKLRSDGLTVALFEQNARLTCSVASRIYLLARGCVHHHGEAQDLLQNQELIEQLI